MSASVAAPTTRMTVDEYLDWAERQPRGRYELVNGVPIAMSPERNVHALVKGAAYRAMRSAVRSARLGCVVFPDGPTIVINPNQSREPDVVVSCGSGFDPDALTLDDPVILVEVSSPSTMTTDTADKLIEYFSLPTVRHYLLVHPGQRMVIHHERRSDGSIATASAGDGELRFDPPGFSVRVADLFDDEGREEPR